MKIIDNIASNIYIKQHINATEREIFDSFTNAQLIEAWFASKAYSNPTNGGIYNFNFSGHHAQMSNQKNYEIIGQFVEIIPNKKVSFEWIKSTLVEIFISKTKYGCRLELLQSGWNLSANGDLKSKQQNLWITFIRNLKSVIEEGIDNRTYLFATKSKELQYFF